MNRFGHYVKHIPYRHTPIDAGVKLTRELCPVNDTEKEQKRRFPYMRYLVTKIICVIFYELKLHLQLIILLALWTIQE